MRLRIFAVRNAAIAGVAAMLLAGANSYASVHLNVDINPFGWGAPPPVVYAPPAYYASPPVVYVGGGRWGGHRQGRDRGDRERGHGGYRRH